MKIDLADISTNESRRLNGFKVLGVFPYHLKFITTKTHIKLCKIRAQIQDLKKGQEPIAEDFYDAELQKQLIPLVWEYCTTALLNDRSFSWALRWMIYQKVSGCSHYHLWNLYFTIMKLNEPAFFLSYWKMLMKVDNTLLKEVTP